MTRFLGALAIVLALAGAGASYLVWSDYHGQFLRMSSELAQMRLSVQLLSQRAPANAGTGDAAAKPVPADDKRAAEITDLKNRLAILEGVWRNPPAAALPQTAALPAITPPAGALAQTDCIPTGTRFLLTPNDTYPVCNTKNTLTLASVGPGQAVLQGLGPVGEGGVAMLSDGKCRVSVLSVMLDGGFAEVRVSC